MRTRTRGTRGVQKRCRGVRRRQIVGDVFIVVMIATRQTLMIKNALIGYISKSFQGNTHH